jgi:hypothetical protein
MKIDNALQTSPVRSAKDAAHIWRSKFFDQSARCEARLRRVVAKVRPGEPVPHQFKAVALAAKQAAETGPNRDKLIAAVDELLPLIELRAYLAHSAMRLIALEGDHLVAFAHAGGDQEFGQKVMLLNTEQRLHALRRLTNLAGRLKICLQSNGTNEPTPPPSPPLP